MSGLNEIARALTSTTTLIRFAAALARSRIVPFRSWSPSCLQPEGHVIVDGGSKTFSSDRFMGLAEIELGRVVEAPECVFHNMNEEHGFVDIEKRSRSSRWEMGGIIPNHVCVAVNLHEYVYGVRTDR